MGGYPVAGTTTVPVAMTTTIGSASTALAGRAAAYEAKKDYDKAAAELQQANQQNPQNLYRLCQVYQAKDEAEKAKMACDKAANFNSLPQINYAFIRTKAKAGA